MFLKLHPLIDIAILAGIVVLLLIWIIRLEVKLRRLLIGAGSKNLDQTLSAIRKEFEALDTFRHESEHYFISVEKRLRRSLQAVETIRFNPFKGQGTGSNQSFATSFINEKGDGVIFSSLYAHDRMSVFSKPIAGFNSTFELTDEEKEVVAKTKEALKK